ncbi:MAG: anti-sigma F factor [Eubacteriales bacterium]
MKPTNEIELKFPGKSINEGFARVSVASFVSLLDPTLEELSEIKTAVSEAVTNCIVHGYGDRIGTVHIKVQLFGNKIRLTVKDSGVGMEDVEKAMEPCFTTGTEDRAGMGFTIMQSFSDKLTVRSKPGKGTTVIMEKTIIRRV